MMEYKKSASQSGKTVIIKFMAVLISSFYVLGPLQFFAEDLLHSISHKLERPSAIISHNMIEGGTNLNIHQSDDHRLSSEGHEHEVLEVLTDLLNFNHMGTDENQGISSLLEIDKHLISIKASINTACLTLTASFIYWVKEIDKGYISALLRPPSLN